MYFLLVAMQFSFLSKDLEIYGSNILNMYKVMVHEGQKVNWKTGQVCYCCVILRHTQKNV